MKIKIAGLTFRVEPFGPISRCLRFTNRSLFLTRVPILMMSQAMSSCNIRTAWKQKATWKRKQNAWSEISITLVFVIAVIKHLEYFKTKWTWPSRSKIYMWHVLQNTYSNTQTVTVHWQQLPGCERRHHYLFEWDTPGEQLDEISGSHDGIWVKRFLSGANTNASLYQVQRGFDVLRER